MVQSYILKAGKQAVFSLKMKTGLLERKISFCANRVEYSARCQKTF